MVLDSTVAGKEGVMTKRLVFTGIAVSVLVIGLVKLRTHWSTN